ncbi:MAG: permease, partial [Gemmatimonadetes bacterium]|nr:permease [Gemmatimonadota bacterium]
VRLVLRQGLVVAGCGLAIGLAAALGATRLIATQLFGVSPADPATFVSVSVLLTGVALAASFIPAYRATKVDPLEALRYE